MKTTHKTKFADFLAEIFKKETISPATVRSLPGSEGGIDGQARPTAFKEVLPEIHPVDLADIVEELSEEHRLAIFEELETDHASDTLEEIEPEVQRSLISSMDKERVADLIDEMTPGQAADVLAALPAKDAEQILNLMEHTEAEKIESLLGKRNETIANLTTKYFIKMLPDMTTDLIISAFRKFAEDADVADYLYVADHDEKLQGVVCLRELLMAKSGSRLKEIMATRVISLEETDTIEEAKDKFSRYRFDALPVVNSGDVIIGVVTYRDIMGLDH